MTEPVEEHPLVATGQPAQIDAAAASVVKQADGKVELSAPLVTAPQSETGGKASAQVAFTPEVRAGKIIFVSEQRNNQRGRSPGVM